MTLLSENSSRTTLLLVSAVAILAVYPTALGIVVAVEWLAGSGAFVDEMLYGSKRRLITQVVIDWVGSVYWWMPIAVLALIAGRIIRSSLLTKILMLAGIVLLVLGLVITTVPMLFSATLGLALILPAVVTALLR